MRIFKIGLAATLVIVISLMFQVGPSVASSSGPGEILGDVLAEDGKPIRNVHVWITSVDGEFLGRQSTDNDGFYRFGARPGRIKIHFTRPGYVNEWYENKTSRDTARVLTVKSAKTQVLRTTILAIGGAIDGRVIDSLGNSATNGRMELFDAKTGNHLQSTTTDADGRYQFLTLPTGSYKVKLWSNARLVGEFYSDKSSLASATRISVSTGKTTSITDMRVANVDGTVSEFSPSFYPTISDSNPAYGQILTADPGTIEPSPDKISYQWLRDGTGIPGATKQKYKVVNADLSTTLSVQVIASKAGFADGVATSESTSVVNVAECAVSVTGRSSSRGVVYLDVAVTSQNAARWELDGVLETYRNRSTPPSTKTKAKISNGKTKIKLTKQPAGTHEYYVVFDGVPGKVFVCSKFSDWVIVK